jgi:hypothetical protein
MPDDPMLGKRYEIEVLVAKGPKPGDETITPHGRQSLSTSFRFKIFVHSD